MTSRAVVKDFDVAEDGGVGCGTGGEMSAVEAFDFESRPEACHAQALSWQLPVRLMLTIIC